MRNWIAVAAVSGFICVAAGAFGAHGLSGKLEPKMLQTFETGVRYHMYHTLAILLTAVLGTRLRESAARGACVAFLIGAILFSGSLYVLAISGIKQLGMITPFGGIAFLVGWGLLAWAASRSAARPEPH